MASPELEPVPITSQKHDPAWKHCQMFKNGDRVQLKCIYCGKMFRGGGIHRIKEHLAGFKGNAATCASVPHDVRLLMQESLDGVVVKRRKKQRIAEEITNVSLVGSDMDPSGNHHGDVSTGVEVIGVSNNSDPTSSVLLDREGTSNNNVVTTVIDGRKRGRKKISNDIYASSNGCSAKPVNDRLYMAIARFLYDIGASMDSVNSAYFNPMVEAIALGGPDVAPPSYDDLRGWISKSLVQETKNEADKLMAGWARTGCSILVDEWSTEKGKSLLNFTAYCPEGMVFLKSVDVSNSINSPDSLYELLKQVVEEVAPKHVLQVVTNSVDRYSYPGKMLMEAFPNLYWTSCALQCLDSILEDFAQLDWINTVIEQARSVTRFFYNNTILLNMMKRCTLGNDIVDIGPTCAATNFTTLERIVDLQHSLQTMVTSQELLDSPYSRKTQGGRVLDIIMDQSFWSSCVLIINLTSPLLRVLRIVSDQKRPAMAYVFAGMYRAKETIKKELVNQEYMVYWNIIDRWWKRQVHNSLHCAGFYLNPKYFYSIEGEMQSKIQSWMFDCIERLVPDPKVQDKISTELNSYKNAAGDFGRKMAVRARDTMLPAEWWSTYGGSCPNLARLAVCILSQTCSSKGHTQDRISFDQIHETRNCIEQQRLRDLMFVRHNLRLKQMGCKSKACDITDPISYRGINFTEEWVKGKNEEFGSSDWTILDQLSANTMLLGPSNDEVEELGSGFDDYEIFESMKGREPGNAEDNAGTP